MKVNIPCTHRTAASHFYTKNMKHIVRFGIIQLIFYTCSYSVVFGYNIDIQYPRIYSNVEDSYFGYTVALLRNRLGPQVLISAPRANSSVLQNQVKRPGVLYNCKISFVMINPSCNEVVLDRRGNTVPADPFRAGRYAYQDLKDDMFLGVSLDVQQNSENGNVVTCGHLWKNQLIRKNHFANGVCYVINKELDERSVKKLLPLVDKDKQTLSQPRIYYYAFGQAGTAAAFSEDGKYLHLGAPGFYDWTGTVLSYSTETNKYNSPIIPDPPMEQKYSPEAYVGYSVASGKFFDSADNFIALGAPRDENSHGQVFVIRALKTQSDRFTVRIKKKGKQFGEYFGATVAAVNVNNDKFTDLLVGAPFHSDTGGDEGKVYVYISNGLGLEESKALLGNNVPNARFGTAIAAVGDVNQDGYNDVAIGAPYENASGAIYIYHGSHMGLNPTYAQRIAASEISPSLSGFGISISRGLDIDNNYYPDILVGSYASAQAVLLRSYPIIQVSSRLEFSPQKINTNNTECKFDRKNVPCLNVTACLQYTGRHTPLSIVFDTEMYMDNERLKAATLSRGFLIQDGKSTSVIRKKVTLDIGADNCFVYQGYIRHDAKDVINPVDFLFQYNIAKEFTNNTFCKNCPIIDPNFPTNNSKSIYFQTGCGKDNECLANLVVKASIAGYSENEDLIIGRNTSLSLEIEVTNTGEPAYLSEMFIYLPSNTPYINQDFCTVVTDQQKQETNASLLCYLGNPLQKDQTVKIVIKIDVSKLPTSTQKLNVILEAKTASTEIQPEDNEVTLPLRFKALADIYVSGQSEPEQIAFHTTEGRPMTITHTYFIMNYGPSPIQTIDIELYVPVALEKENKYTDFVIFTQLEADSGERFTIPAKCNDSSIELMPSISLEKPVDGSSYDEDDLIIQNKNNRVYRDVLDQNETADLDLQYASSRTKKSLQTSVKKKDIVIDCNTAKCIMMQCAASPFLNSKNFAKISVTMQLKADILNDYLESWYRLEFITRGHISIRDGSSNIQPEKHQPDETQVKTIVVRPGPPPAEEIAKWIIFASIGIGLLLFIIILITLIKVGFFKRQQKDKMQQMMLNADLKEWEPDIGQDEPKTSDNATLHT